MPHELSHSAVLLLEMEILSAIKMNGDNVRQKSMCMADLSEMSSALVSVG